MINDLMRLTRSELWNRVLHPYRENELLRFKLMNLSIDNEELSRENREFKKGLGKDRLVMEAEKNAQYWAHRWTDLYHFVRDRICPACEDALSRRIKE